MQILTCNRRLLCKLGEGETHFPFVKAPSSAHIKTGWFIEPAHADAAIGDAAIADANFWA
jgi:hypothetical protein